MKNTYLFASFILFIFFTIYIFRKSDNINEIPILSQMTNSIKTNHYNIKRKVTNEPIYRKLQPEYSETKFVGKNKMDKNSINEEIIEEICPTGYFIDEIIYSNKKNNLNSFFGKCSNGDKLKLFGKIINNNNVKNIKNSNGFNNFRVFHNNDFVTNFDQNQNQNQNQNQDKTLNKSDKYLLKCPNNKIIVGYRGRFDDKIKHLQFICNDKNIIKELPKMYKKCGNNGDVCNFEKNNQKIYYGIPGRKLIEVDKKNIKKDKFTCYSSAYFPKHGTSVLPINDPIPNEKKSCFIEKKSLLSPDEYKKLRGELKYKLYGAWSNI